ncbi:heme lyase CcmF/NrfE family subunit [Vibrio rotiferianus]|uniref:heme lyase CcmF/NrfE family subunit n=1 Tax=Vibrio rotiferianus TaxID=190895 RepID=UPI00390A77F1
MEAELGLFLLILVSIGSTCAAFLYWIRRAIGKTVALPHQTATSYIISLASFICLSLLIVCFVQDNFALEYVVTHSNSQLPVAFKVAATWGGHQGSMLFWVVTLSMWASLIAFKSPVNAQYTGDCLGIMNVLIAIFAWFTLATSNPFEYAQSFALEGRDLNPMLQDVGLIIHPPLLYLGYVGYSAVLALALAALFGRQPHHEWYAFVRGIAYFAWGTLTAGILVGSWWAYNELGWGGWWFWDPVENASLMPWLVGTALLHSIHLSARNKGAIWSTYALAFSTFSLSVLGTFVVRSGVLTSVHAFAVDPTKGLALLCVLVIIVFVTFGSLIYRGQQIPQSNIDTIFSRAYLCYMAIGLLVIATAIVFLGTFYPMIYQVLGAGSISVGPPYFNSLIYPLFVFSLVVLACSTFCSWQHSRAGKDLKVLCLIASLSVITASIVAIMVNTGLMLGVIFALAIYVVSSHAFQWARSGAKISTAPKLFAHIGFVIAGVGAIVNASYSYEFSYRMSPNSQHQFQNVSLEYVDTHWKVGPNYTSEIAEIRLSTTEQHSFTLLPERRHYSVRVMNMTEPAIKSFWHGDYYITLGEKLSEQSYAVKVQYRAAIWWIWCGGIIALISMLSALLPKRSWSRVSDESFA